MIQVLWKTVCQFHKNLNTELPYDPAISLVDVHPTEMKTYVCPETCTPVFIAVLLMKRKAGNTPEAYQLVNGQIEVHPYNISIKRREVLIHSITRMNLKSICVS